jgi:hypothetical protein
LRRLDAVLAYDMWDYAVEEVQKRRKQRSEDLKREDDRHR